MRRVLSALPLACATALAVLAVVSVAAPVASAAAPDDPAPSCPLDPETGECLPDRDRDGRGDTVDNCPDHFNPGQEDDDGDSVGNACDPTPNGGGPPPPPEDPPPNTPGTNCDGGEGVYVYQHVDYQGGCYKLTGDSGHAYYWSTVGNDAASSVRIVGGWAIVLHTEAWYSGGTVALTVDSPNPWSWGGSWSWNDTISSARVGRFEYYGEADEGFEPWEVSTTEAVVGGPTRPNANQQSLADSLQGSTCRKAGWRRTRGRWVYRRSFEQWVYWCWRDGSITHWSVQEPEPYSVGEFCSLAGGPDSSRVAGGRNWGSVVVRTAAHWSCNTWFPPPAHVVNDVTAIEVEYLVGGSSRRVSM